MGNKDKIFITIHKKNRQLIRRQIIPKSDSFDVNGKSYIIDGESYYIFRGRAVYTYLEDVPTPLRLKDIVVTKDKKEVLLYDAIEVDADNLNTFKKAKTVRDIFEAVNDGMKESVLMFALLGVMILGFGFLWFTFSNQYTELVAMMRELLEIFAGGAR